MSEYRTPNPSAAETGLGSATPAKPRADGKALDPEGRAPPAVDVPVLPEQPDVVAHPDATGEHHITLGEVRGRASHLEFGERKEILNPFLGRPDHRGRAPAPPTASARGTGAPHTGQTTEAADITLLQVGQCRAPVD